MVHLGNPIRDFVMYVPTHGRKKPGRQRTLFTNIIFIVFWGILIICWRWLKSAINGGNLWATAPQPKDDEDDESNHV